MIHKAHPIFPMRKIKQMICGMLLMLPVLGSQKAYTKAHPVSDFTQRSLWILMTTFILLIDTILVKTFTMQQSKVTILVPLPVLHYPVQLVHSRHLCQQGSMSNQEHVRFQVRLVQYSSTLPTLSLQPPQQACHILENFILMCWIKLQLFPTQARRSPIPKMLQSLHLLQAILAEIYRFML